MARSATSSPVAPPPPPPPPPPQLELELESSEPPRGRAKEKKLMDFREIVALFHAREPPPPSPDDGWEALWLATLAEAREAAPKRQSKAVAAMQQPPPRGRAPPPPDAAKSGGPEPPKRPRQSSGADLEPNKLSRVNRAPARPKPGGSKLLQKLGGARGT